LAEKPGPEARIQTVLLLIWVSRSAIGYSRFLTPSTVLWSYLLEKSRKVCDKVDGMLDFRTVGVLALLVWYISTGAKGTLRLLTSVIFSSSSSPSLSS